MQRNNFRPLTFLVSGMARPCPGIRDEHHRPALLLSSEVSVVIWSKSQRERKNIGICCPWIGWNLKYALCRCLRETQLTEGDSWILIESMFILRLSERNMFIKSFRCRRITTDVKKYYHYKNVRETPLWGATIKSRRFFWWTTDAVSIPINLCDS